MIIITKIVYIVKKVVGLNSFNDDMLMMHQQWHQGGTLLGKIGKMISSITQAMDQALRSIAGLGNIGSASAPATGGLAGLASATQLPKVITFVVTTVGPIGAQMLKASGIMAIITVGSQAAISTATTLAQRSDQARAIITDTLRNPINLDKALNPAYHGKRDELATVGSEAMTAAYLKAKYGPGYKVAPFLGYGSDNLPPQGYTLPSDLDAFELARRRQFLAEQRRRDQQIAQDYQEQRDRSLFEANIGSFFANTIVVSTPLISESGPHGVEFTEIRYRNVDTVTTTITSDTVHGSVIEYINSVNGQGTEAYTETIKKTIYGDTTVRYIMSIYEGGTNVGPKTYINTISDNERTRVIIRAADQYLERITGAKGPRLNGASTTESPADSARISR